MHPTFEPRNPDFETLVRDGFARQSLMRTFGARLETVEPGLVVLTLGLDPALLQQHGFLHGGVSGAMLDTACGFAALSLMSPGAGVLTVEYKINFLAPARGRSFRFEGRVIRPGRTLLRTEGAALAMDGNGETPTLIATVSATMMCVQGQGIVG
ncbi:PaaI family thioesterase [Sedimentitalea sp. JM2-8]|uniref:Medium/long-chain acyl-CoA thioesterase YigI n=1 Tax=Sedimentitalea xiamensis TaxID=3050037 RepID=A0ABT7FGB6_9RHOB|nr:PaaI family thioesterase [Sedimentitalea xiamensis]MDK3074166.1 PaaI family thioesterase [Sedimentitalea xiamensis]